MENIVWAAQVSQNLIHYLATASGEQHDAAVYDTGYEFDPRSHDAVLFIASVAMIKAGCQALNRTEPLPKDGSVVKRDVEPQNERMHKSYMDRLAREKKFEEKDDVYIPDSEKYTDLVIDAADREIFEESEDKRILYSQMTPEEKKLYRKIKFEGFFEAGPGYLILFLFVGLIIFIWTRI